MPDTPGTKRHWRTLPATICCLASLCCGVTTSGAGTYTSSAHGQSIERTVMLTKGYATGNCAHCHEQHASVEGSEPAPVGGAPSTFLTFANEENLCYGCHGSGGAGAATDDIEADSTKAYSHNLAGYDGKHLPNETQASISAAKHVECPDCHNPHQVGTGNHTAGSNAIPTPSPLNGATGVVPTFSGFNWTSPVTYSALQTATLEYQICFKCHSGAVGNPTAWSGTSGSTSWMDVGLEFSSGNKSGHPIVTGLNNYPNSYSGANGRNANQINKGLTAAQLTAPWNVNIGTQTMYCSDCHASNSGVAGPHGSAYKWLLSGTNKAWPYLTAANNGSNSQEAYAAGPLSFRRLGDTTTSLGTDNGLFCSNCHPDPAGSNKVHINGNHRPRARCADCHLRVPHGGKVSRLIAAVNAATFAAGNMPLRYTANGEGKTSVVDDAGAGFDDDAPIIRQFTKCTPWDYSDNNCYSTSMFYSASGKTCNSEHNGAVFDNPNDPDSPESW